jgi:2-keto-3-deoxy-L-rhamnonate aldolase RhmA
MTPTLRNPARAKLEAGKLALGVGLRQARTVDIAPAMATAGMDWLFIDLEHGTMPLDMAVQISIAANAAGISPIVRVPYGQYDMATRALDGGAMGIVVPHIDTADEAAAMADRLRYPPRGHRSVAGAMPQLGFQALPLADAAAAVNEQILLVAMLETPKAISNADAIAAVPGIDVLLIGTNDLCMEMGIPGEVMHADVDKAYQAAAAACRSRGKWLGMGGVYTEAGIAAYVNRGARFVLTGSDLSYLMAGVAARAQACGKIVV